MSNLISSPQIPYVTLKLDTKNILYILCSIFCAFGHFLLKLLHINFNIWTYRVTLASGDLSPTPVYSRVLVIWSLVFCVVFYIWLFVLCPFLFVHYVVCPSSICIFSLLNYVTIKTRMWNTLFDQIYACRIVFITRSLYR